MKPRNDATWGFDGRPQRHDAPDGWEFVRNWGEGTVDVSKIEGDPKRRIRVLSPSNMDSFSGPGRSVEAADHLINAAAEVGWVRDIPGWLRLINPEVRKTKFGTDGVGVRADFAYRKVQHRFYGHREAYVIFRAASN